MILKRSRSKQGIFLALLFLVLLSNFLVYRLPVIPMPTDSKGVVIGSLLDFAIVAPLLILALTRNKGFTVKRFLTFMALGLVAARFVIPIEYFEPFKFLPYMAIGFEGLILIAEVGLLIVLARHLPGIIKQLKNENVSTLFAFPAMVKEKVSANPLISIIAAESLMFYYAFASWKRQPPVGESMFTLHQKTSMLAFNIMLIHAIVIETIGIHWWLHEKSMVLSIVLLLLNVYSVIYFIANIQAIRLNPIKMDTNHMQISLGLGKRMEIPYEFIERVEWGTQAENYSLKNKEVIEFIARDLEEVKPQCIIHLNRPLTAILFLGKEKKFRTVAIRLDEPERFKQVLANRTNNIQDN